MVIRSIKGLSLLELLATLASLSVLIGLATPSFMQMMAEQRLRNVSAELRVSLMTARSEAVKRSEGVSLVKKDSDWSTGWCLEAGTESTCSGQPLQEFRAPPSSITVALNGVSNGDPLRFNAWGRVPGCPTFALQADTAGATCKLCLMVASDGRVQSTSGDCPTDCNGVSDDMSWSEACS